MRGINMIETAEIKSAVVEKLYRFLTYFNNEFYPVFSSTVFFDIISLYKEFKDLDKDLSLDTRITREEFLDGLSKKLQLEASNPPNFAVEKLLNIVINDSPVQIPLNDLLYKKPYRLTTPKEVEKANLDLISTCVDFIEKNKNCLPSSFSFKEFFYALFALHKDFLASRQENNGVVLREQNITDILKPENNISNMEFQTYITEILVLPNPTVTEDRAGDSLPYSVQREQNYST